MERIWIYYYSFLLMILIVALTYYFLLIVAHDSNEHFIGVNLTKQNDTCKIVWLGGWDFDSLYTNVTVNGISVGHPRPNDIIYDGFCKNLTVKMHDKSVHHDMLLYQYNYTGGT